MKRTAKLVEVNLLPDIKQEVLVARQMRDRVATWSILALAIAVTIVIVLGAIVLIVQNLIMSSQKNQIEADFKKYSSYQGAGSLLTVQKQLKVLNDIHSKKTVTSRMFVLIVQVITNYNLDITISKIDLDPHKQKIILEGYSETGYIELERLVKTLNNSEIAYVPTQRLIEIGQKASEKQAESEKELNDELEKAGYKKLLREDASLLNDASTGERSDGKKIWMFKLGLALDQEFFLASEKNAIIKGTSYRDVTDSILSIPPDLFGSLNDYKGDKKEK